MGSEILHEENGTNMVKKEETETRLKKLEPIIGSLDKKQEFLNNMEPD